MKGSTTRAEHLAWCKQRALAYCDAGDPLQALMSMMSDMGKHPETRSHTLDVLTLALIAGGELKTVEKARQHINNYQ